MSSHMVFYCSREHYVTAAKSAGEGLFLWLLWECCLVTGHAKVTGAGAQDAVTVHHQDVLKGSVKQAGGRTGEISWQQGKHLALQARRCQPNSVTP